MNLDVLKRKNDLELNYLELDNLLFVYVQVPNDLDSTIKLYKLGWVYYIAEAVPENCIKTYKTLYYLDNTFSNLKEPLEIYDTEIIKRS